MSVVLVTGVSRHLGSRLARSLARDGFFDAVIGVDVVPPRESIGRAQFVRADIRTPAIARLVASRKVDTVIHMGVLTTPTGAGGRAAMKEINVFGTLQLLAACQRAPSVKRLVVKSSTSVYGSGPNDPAMFTEHQTARTLPRGGFPKDSLDVEDAVRGFARRRPEVEVTVLRLANVLGPRMETPLTKYFALPLVPTVMGYDPRLMFLHEDDAVAVHAHAALGAAPGTFNIAGDGVLTMAQAVARAGSVPVPVPSPFGALVGRSIRKFGFVDFQPEDIGYLTYGRGVDTTAMRTVLGFAPRFSTAEAFAAGPGRALEAVGRVG